MEHLLEWDEFDPKENRLNEASKGGWTLSSTGSPEMYRFSGKTYPTLSYSKKSNKIFGRDDNGKNPSKSLETENLTSAGIKEILNGISKPHPTQDQIEEFLNRISKINESKTPLDKGGKWYKECKKLLTDFKSKKITLEDLENELLSINPNKDKIGIIYYNDWIKDNIKSYNKGDKYVLSLDSSGSILNSGDEDDEDDDLDEETIIEFVEDINESELDSIFEGYKEWTPEAKLELKDISNKAKSFVTSKGKVKAKIIVSTAEPVMIGIKAEDGTDIDNKFRMDLIETVFNKNKKDDIRLIDPSYSSGGSGINSSRIQLTPGQWKKVLGI